MRAAYIEEQRRYTLTELSVLLGDGEDRAASIIQRLKSFGIVRTVRSSDTQKNMSDLIDDEILVADVTPDSKQYYVFTFVGLVVIGRFVLKCYPKYLPGSPFLPSKMAQVMKVLERYNAREQVISLFNEARAERGSNLLAIMLFLIRDYFDNGIYTNSQDTLETNGTGEINWDRTINETFALLNNARPHYMNLITKRRLDDERDFFRRLHASVLTQFTKELREADLLTLLEVPEVDLSDDPVDLLGDTDYLLYRIEGELGVQFNTRKQTVLRALHAYLSNGATLGDEHNCSVFGTNSFHLVWESVCSDVLRNQLKAPLSTLRLPVPLDSRFDANSSLFTLIDKPVWSGSDAAGEFSKQAEATLVPDLVTLDVSQDRYQLLILDAKYYRVNLSRDQKLSGQPGIGDVTKQYLYQLAFRDFSEAHGIHETKNCFLFPSDGQVVENIGYTALDMLSHLGLENIQLRLLPATVMYDLYLRNDQLELSSLCL